MISCPVAGGRDGPGEDSPAAFRTEATSPSGGGAAVAPVPMVDDGTGIVYEYANDGRWAVAMSAPGPDIVQ